MGSKTNFKGGYKIVSLLGIAIALSMESTTVSGIYNRIESSYRKPILLSGIVIDGVEKNDVFVVPQLDGTSYVLENVYGLDIIIDDEDGVTCKRHAYGRINRAEWSVGGATIEKGLADEIGVKGLGIDEDGLVYVVVKYNPNADEEGTYLEITNIDVATDGDSGEAVIQGYSKYTFVVNEEGTLDVTNTEL